MKFVSHQLENAIQTQVVHPVHPVQRATFDALKHMMSEVQHVDPKLKFGVRAEVPSRWNGSWGKGQKGILKVGHPFALLGPAGTASKFAKFLIPDQDNETIDDRRKPLRNATGKITLLRVIPTMTFIHFLTGKSSGILSDISSDILFGILSSISSGILSSGILSGKSSGILSGISSGILSDISSGILSGISSGSLSGISHGILSGISSDILSGIFSHILSGISSDILSGISSDILSDISSDILSDIFSDILAVEVRQCPLRSGSHG